ncbi:MAG: ATP-dependent helicase HrpB [Desulfobulbaceae bacterium]|nr:ATP-dependent helicase HrpB [Desulfobulbaceae bacterium]
MQSLPVNDIIRELKQALRDSNCAILTAPPGSGKTTAVPPALLDEPWLAGQSILVLEPRRLAARMAAGFMASVIGEKAGQSIGYRVRFDSRVSAETRIEVLTEGVLLRQLQNDPELSGVGLVIFDEFHERSLASDLALALCLDVLAGLRDDLRLLVMSATIDAAQVSRFLHHAPVISARGTMYPVEIIHLPPPVRLDSNRIDHIVLNTAAAVRNALQEQQGDLLVFLPGIGEIRRTLEQLASLVDAGDLLLLPLHGNLKLTDQAGVVEPDAQGRRRVILATTIAETSITIEGIGTVIDCGWKRVPRFDPDSNLTRLETVRISKASADQRTGRAGRVGPGTCYRLWSRGVEQSLLSFDRPEINQADLATLALELALWGVRDPGELHWLNPPRAGTFMQARELLFSLHGTDKQGRITETGKKMAVLPLHPRLAHMLVTAAEYNALSLACDLAALISERDILRLKATSVDIEDRLYVLQRYRGQGGRAARALGADAGSCRQVCRVSDQLGKLMARPLARENDKGQLSVGALLSLAYPDRVAGKRSVGNGSYKMVSGHGARLPDRDLLSRAGWLAVASLRAGKREGRIFLAAEIDRQEIMELHGGSLTGEDRIRWDSEAAQVKARRLTRLGELTLEDVPLDDPNLEDVQAEVISAIRTEGLLLLPWTDQAVILRNRIQCLRLWLPEAQWPECSDEHLLATLEEWLGPFLPGIRTGKQLRQLKMETILLSMLDWEQQVRLDQDAPTHIRVPSGSKIKLQYSIGEPPVLAVRLQEMFGLAETPAVCRGRVPILLHLLSPAGRPIQITGDLHGFWDGSYQAVKKEMKGRYPKHHWPDDPWQATPTARVKPKKRK